MKVVNVRVKFIRPQYNNLEEWCKDKKNVYIGNKHHVVIYKNSEKYSYPPEDSFLHNPYASISDKNMACDMYYKYITEKLDEENINGIYHRTIKNLKGKKLGCFCSPSRCHGDELIKIYNERFS